MLEIDLDVIKEIAVRKREENQAFRAYLEKQDVSYIDKVVQRINETISAKVSCVDCGNCCSNLRPIATTEELTKFVKPKDVEVVRYDQYIKCKYVKDKKCSIYTDRYQECKDFPYLDVDGFVSRMVGNLQSYELCPILFNVIEDLKIELGWRV